MTFSRKLFKRAIISIAISIVLYISLGFTLLPYLIEDQLKKQVYTHTKRLLLCSDLTFNPLTLELRIIDLKFLNKDRTPFIEWDLFSIDIEAASIFKQAVILKHIQLIAPTITVRRFSEDQFNFSDLIKASDPQPEQKPKENQDIIPIEIQQLLIDKGYVHYSDHLKKRLRTAHLSDLSFQLTAFKTVLKTGEKNPYNLEAYGPKGGFFQWNGWFTLSPIESDATIILSNIGLHTMADYYAEELPFQLDNGTLSIQTDYRLSSGKSFEFSTSNGVISLKNIQISEKETSAPLLQTSLLQLDNMSFVLNDKVLSAKTLLLSDSTVNITYAGKDNINIIKAMDFSAFTQPQTESDVDESNTTTDNETPSFRWNIGQVKTDGILLSFDDKTTQPPKQWIVSNIQSNLGPITNSGAPFLLNLETQVNQHATINVKGKGDLFPFSLQLNINEKGFKIAEIQRYISPFINIMINQGTIDTQLSLQINTSDSPPMVKLAGHLQSHDLDIADGDKELPLLKWKTLALDSIYFDLQKKQLDINNVAIQSPYIKLQIGTDKTTNVQNLIISESTQDNETQAIQTDNHSTDVSPFNVAINTIKINDGINDFSDLSITPDFITKIGELNGTITDISTDPKRTSTIDLTGTVDKVSPVTISGKTKPLSKPPFLDADMAFHHLEMSAFTPYSGTYAGYKIDRGQLSLDLSYQLENNQLHGTNKITIHKLKLGDTVESEKAVKLPLKLALALLTDENGMIDLDLVVKGDVSKPGFSVSGIVWKVLRNLIVKMVASPFKFLASLVGGSGTEDLGSIQFPHGSDMLRPTEFDKLASLSKAIKTRPQISLNIAGGTHYHEDVRVIKLQKIDKHLKTLSGVQQPLTTAKQNPDWILALKGEYLKTSGEPFAELLKRLNLKSQKAKVKQTLESVQLSAIDYAFNFLKEKQVVSLEEIQTLAIQRAKNIKEILMKTHQIDPGRLFLNAKTISPSDNASVVHFEIDVK